jgi:hypothetical protein
MGVGWAKHTRDQKEQTWADEQGPRGESMGASGRGPERGSRAQCGSTGGREPKQHPPPLGLSRARNPFLPFFRCGAPLTSRARTASSAQLFISRQSPASNLADGASVKWRMSRSMSMGIGLSVLSMAQSPTHACHALSHGSSLAATSPRAPYPPRPRNRGPPPLTVPTARSPPGCGLPVPLPPFSPAHSLTCAD